MYFTKESSDQLKCNICSIILTTDNKNSIPKDHIKNSHKDVYELHKDILECSMGYQIEFLQFSMAGNKTQPVIIEEICETQAEVIQDQLPKAIEDNMQYILLRSVKSEDTCRKRSWVWKYFDKLSSTIFRCNLCDVVLSIKGCNSNNMNRHIRSRHPVVYNSEVELKMKNENEKRPDTINPGKPLRSWVWTYFTRDSRTRATCKLCDTTITHGGNATGNLNRHLKIIHDKVDVVGRPRRSWVWTYFIRQSKTHATCTLCDKTLSHGVHTIGNLSRHLKLKHKATSDEKGGKRSWIWEYCEVISDTISRCKLCDLNVSVIGQNQSNMNRHIRKKHSDVYESEILPRLGDGRQKTSQTSSMRKYRRSWFWSFFTKIAPREALCHLCDNKVQLRADGKASLHLRKHLSTVHFNTDDRDCWVWVVFVEGDNKYSCKICTYECTKTDDMENNLRVIRDHLKTEHGLESDAQIFAVRESDDSEEDETEDSKNEKGRRKRSWIWDYFEELPNKLNQCKLCNMSLSIVSGSQGNLNRHVRSNHPVIYKAEVLPMLRNRRPRKYKESDDRDSEDERNHEHENEDKIKSGTEYEESDESGNECVKNEKGRKKRSWIWDYFEELPNRMNQCKLCNMSLSIISGNQGNLNRHVRTNHPIVYESEVLPMLRKGRKRKEKESNVKESDDETNIEEEYKIENETDYEESE